MYCGASDTRHVTTKRLLARHRTSLRRVKPPWAARYECLTRPYMVAVAATLTIVRPGSGGWNKAYMSLWYLVWKVLLHWLGICEAFECALDFFRFIAKNNFHGTWPEKVPEVKYFRKFSMDFNKQGLRGKSILQLLVFFQEVFFSNFWDFTKTVYFCWKLFFKKLCFLLSHVFDFKKLGLKWKDMIPFIYFNQQNQRFFI